MDDSKTKLISKQTLAKVLTKLNKDFINDLPIEPEQLLQYASRRTDPVISENISYSLGKSMIDHRLSDEDYLITFFKAINHVFSNKVPSEKPQASILVSQTGAGKTNLRQLLLNKNDNIVIINSDQYKKFRPDVKEILQENPTHFGALTGIDCYDHARNINDFAIANSYNFLIEAAPSLSQGLLGVDLNALDNKYETKFHFLAVGDLISSLAIHYRYEQDIQEGKQNGDTKLTDLKRHDESYEAVENILKSSNPEKVHIYRRGTKEENMVPIEIFYNAPGNEKTILSNLRILNTERDRSNNKYALGTGDNNFKSDYETISSSMQFRKAPELQFQQLKEIYEKYLSYIAKTKSLEM